jgi:hypothetical protein
MLGPGQLGITKRLCTSVICSGVGATRLRGPFSLRVRRSRASAHLDVLRNDVAFNTTMPSVPAIDVVAAGSSQQFIWLVWTPGW